MKTTVTLVNDFHGTLTIVVPKHGQITRRVERRAYRDLCGFSDCVCSGYAGVRGGLYYVESADDEERMFDVIHTHPELPPTL